MDKKLSFVDWLLIIGFFAFGVYLNMNVTDSTWLAMLISALVFIPLAIAKSAAKDRAVRKELEAKQKIKQQEIEALNRSVRQGTWSFPEETFYQLCQQSHITHLNSEFSRNKAVQLAEQAIQASDSRIQLSNCTEYLKPENLERYLKNGDALAKKAEAERLRQQRLPKNADATSSEQSFLTRAAALANRTGNQKRVTMLSNMVNDYAGKIFAAKQGEEALRTLGMIYMDQQKKGSDWAVIGGIAEGIAGPAAGVMAAAQTMEGNRRIQEHNAAMRKASMDILSGIPQIAGNRYELEDQQSKVSARLREAERKLTLSSPDAETIWRSLQTQEVTVKKNPSGVLAISLPLKLTSPLQLDVPEGVCMVIDGTITGEVWFEDAFVGPVYFPLPLYGIPTNMTAPVTLDGMCGRSVEIDGKYTVKIAEKQTLWVMEA